MLTLANYGGKGPIAFLSHQQEPAMKKFSENGAERILASVTKRLLQLKAIVKEQPIIIFSMTGELARIKKNLVVNQAQVNSQRWSQKGMDLGDNQPMAHKEQWEKIDKPLQEVNAHFYHQLSHTKQTGEAADGNREVDKLICRVKLQEITELFQKMHDELNHPSVNMVQIELRLRNLNIPNWRT